MYGHESLNTIKTLIIDLSKIVNLHIKFNAENSDTAKPYP